MSLNPDVLAALNESSTLSLINELVVLRKVTQSTPDFQKVADDVVGSASNIHTWRKYRQFKA